LTFRTGTLWDELLELLGDVRGKHIHDTKPLCERECVLPCQTDRIEVIFFPGDERRLGGVEPSITCSCDRVFPDWLWKQPINEKTLFV